MLDEFFVLLSPKFYNAICRKSRWTSTLPTTWTWLTSMRRSTCCMKVVACAACWQCRIEFLSEAVCIMSGCNLDCVVGTRTLFPRLAWNLDTLWTHCYNNVFCWMPWWWFLLCSTVLTCISVANVLFLKYFLLVNFPWINNWSLFSVAHFIVCRQCEM